MLLEKILEEGSVYNEDRSREILSTHENEHENDKRYLLGNGHTTNVNITRI